MIYKIHLSFVYAYLPFWISKQERSLKTMQSDIWKWIVEMSFERQRQYVVQAVSKNIIHKQVKQPKSLYTGVIATV